MEGLRSPGGDAPCISELAGAAASVRACRASPAPGRLGGSSAPGMCPPFEEDEMRSFPRTLRFWTALFMLIYWGAMHVAPAAAGLAPSRISGETSVTSARDADLLVVQRTLENKLVAQKLRDYGVAPENVKTRLASLSDQDLHTLASASKGLPSGSDGLGALIAVLIIVLLVIVILKLLNKQIIVR